MINYWDEEATKDAEKQHKEPYVPDPEEVEFFPPFPFPYLGQFVPDGWMKVDGAEWFVDSSGFGLDTEPALSVRQFLSVLRYHLNEHPEDGFAVTSAGQFQVYVAAYRPFPDPNVVVLPFSATPE